MPAVVHRTKGLLDLRAVSVMGLSAKPGSKNPIGMFGTGLKYAIATLCRNGCAPVIWIGRDRYTFTAKKGEFRGQEFQQLRMRRDAPGLLKPAYKPLPFTTEYGKFWQVWMAFRELESNTRDEGGETFLLEDDDLVRDAGVPGETRIVIDLAEYVHAWITRDVTFLPNGARAPLEDGPTIQAFTDGPRDMLYWRGLRVKDLVAKQTVRTWNFLAPMQLTEDRTMASEWGARWELAAFVAQSDDAALIRDVITADHKHWEHRLDWPSHITPSATFQRVSIEERGRSHGSWGYVSGHVPRRPRKRNAWDDATRPWKIEADSDDPKRIVTATGVPILERPDDFDADDWLELAERLLVVVNKPALAETPAFEAPATHDDQEIPF